MKGLDIVELRKKLNITQEELGEMIGVSRNTIYNYEKGGKIPDSKCTILSKLMNQNIAQNINPNKNTEHVEEETTSYATGFDKKIAGYKKDIEVLRKEINVLKIKEPDSLKIIDLFRKINIFQELITVTLEAKKDKEESDLLLERLNKEGKL